MLAYTTEQERSIFTQIYFIRCQTSNIKIY